MLQEMAPAPQSPAPAVATTDATAKPFVSAGQRLHNISTYLGVDWLFNAAAGVSFAYWGKVSQAGKKYWSGPIEKGFERILKPVIKNPQSLEYSVHKGGMFLSIIAGGMFTIPPLLFLEKNTVKKSITQTYDRLIYGKDAIDADSKFQTSYEAIENAPKKDFWTGMTSRFAALTPLLLVTVFIPKTRDWADKNYFSRLSDFSEHMAGKIGIKGEKLKAVEVGKTKEGSSISAWKFIHDNIAFDAGLGIPYALLHDFFYNAFSGEKQKKKDAREPKASPSPTITESAPAMTEEKVVATGSATTASHVAREEHRRSELGVNGSPAVSA
jgi:hypothetical protein